MNTKKNINKPRKVSTFLPKILDKFNKKKGSKILELKMNWKQIVGDDLSNKCTVYSLKKINNQNVLTIVSDSAEILEVSYSAENIKEKINKFFFSEFISVIKFKKSLQI